MKGPASAGSFIVFEEEYAGKDKDKNKEIRVRKVLLYWSKAQADMAKRKREEKLAKAARLVKNNAYSIKKGVDEYTKENALSVKRIARALGAATCQVLKGGIIHLDDVGGAIAFQKVRNKKGEMVDTLAYSEQDEIALDYKAIQGTFGTNFYNIYPRQEMFNKFLKHITL